MSENKNTERSLSDCQAEPDALIREDVRGLKVAISGLSGLDTEDTEAAVAFAIAEFERREPPQ